MSSARPSVPSRAPIPLSAPQVGAVFFGVAAIVALGIAAALWPVHGWRAAPPRFGLALALLGFALFCAVTSGLTQRPGFALRRALGATSIAIIALAGAIELIVGGGLRSPLVGVTALTVCIGGAVIGTGGAAGLAGAALLQIAALAWFELHRGMPLAGVEPSVPLALALQGVVVAASAAGAVLIARLLAYSRHVAIEREQRFRGLLGIAADHYWELDHQFRFIQLSVSGDLDSDVLPPRWFKRTPWQIDDLGIADDQLDAHRADLEAHRPFSALLLQQRDKNGSWHVRSVSGTPKFDADRRFRGYWGVVRDVTHEAAAQHAVRASEARYRELFARSPSPLLLHRRGNIVDANDAAARLLGFSDVAAMTGFSVLGFFPAGEVRERALTQLAAIEKLPLGAGLPVQELQIRSIDGQPLVVQSTAVRVEAADGPANLAIFLDVTARQAVESALRRSEAMLSHLFATSPDGIALIEVASGRYTMVNPAFCRLTGFEAAEVVGRSDAELGLWHDPRAAAGLAARLQRESSVTGFATVFSRRTGQLVSVLLAAGRFVMDGRDYLVVNVRDVTASERTRLEHAAILERASIGIAFARERRFLQANPCFEAMFGWPLDSVAGQPDSVVWADQDGDDAAGAVEDDVGSSAIDALAAPLLAAGRSFEVEREMRRRDGSRFWCRLLAQAVDPSDPANGGTIWIAEDVTERRRLDRALAAARDAAEAASRAKSAFLANTSHEIRTPLNGLIGLARLAMQAELTEPRRRDYLAQILESAQGLAGIMSDVLDVSKIEAGQIALESVPFSLRDSLAAMRQAYRPMSESKGIALDFELAPALPETVVGDPVRLRQILSNFIGNALKFTDHGRVVVAATLTARGDVRIAVSDTGPGIDPATEAQLFTPFSQGDSSSTRRYGGTGLGLSICRELAQLMGGRIGVESRHGEGSTFWVELPLAAGDALPAVVSTEADDLRQLAGRRVLVVEDNPVNMMIVAAMLEGWGVQVGQAFDGRMAIDVVHDAAERGEPFEAVLMDLQMPVMNGHEAARQLRRHFGPQDLPILALTAAALVSEREEALRAGMNDFLTKPIDAPRLRETLARRLAARRGG